jgi:molybdopterin-guanine dinucleotide biosynthesis protein B
VGVVKHSSDAHPLHRPGSDTARYAESGAEFVAFATPAGVQLTLAEAPVDALPRLLAALAHTVDVVLVEGWKDGPLPKVEVWREGHGVLLAPTHPEVRAVVTDAAALPVALPRFGPDEVEALAGFVARFAREGGHGP